MSRLLHTKGVPECAPAPTVSHIISCGLMTQMTADTWAGKVLYSTRTPSNVPPKASWVCALGRPQIWVGETCTQTLSPCFQSWMCSPTERISPAQSDPGTKLSFTLIFENHNQPLWTLADTVQTVAHTAKETFQSQSICRGTKRGYKSIYNHASAGYKLTCTETAWILSKTSVALGSSTATSLSSRRRIPSPHFSNAMCQSGRRFKSNSDLDIPLEDDIHGLS
jgi:hypothetical protein